MTLFANNLIADQFGFPVAAGGGPRFLAYNTPDEIQITEGNLSAFPGGVWALGDNDTVAGSDDSNERLFGNDGEDIIGGGFGNDIVYGGKDDDTLDGNEGNDVIRGDLDDDVLFGGFDNDIIRGGQGDDVIEGGSGNDFLVGDRGFDVLIGSEGTDTFVLRADEASFDLSRADVLADFDFRQGDRIGLTDGLTEIGLTFDENQQVDYDRDGLIDDLVIRLTSTGQILGVVLNVEPFDLQDQFEAVNLGIFNINGSQFAYLP